VDDLTGPTYDGLTSKLKPFKKAKYSAVENCLERTIAELEAWHHRFDPSWFLTILIADVHIDKSLTEQSDPKKQEVSCLKAIRDAIHDRSTAEWNKSSIFCSLDLLTQDRIPISGSDSCLSRISNTNTPILLDKTAYSEDTDVSVAATHVYDLARLLSASQPSTLGLLRCLGVSKAYDASGRVPQFQFFFEIPSDCEHPSSLRFLLSQTSPSLDAKFHLAKSMARAVMSVHTASFVHKNIRPESIIVFEKADPQSLISFLIGFEQFRPAAAGTSLVGDMYWERNLYRHPKRQGILPEDMYVMQHDIYSLGVCLLEIGLWTSFVLPLHPPQPGAALNISSQLAMRNQHKAATEIKRLLVTMSTDELPGRMGRTYTEVVMSCLTCLDPEESNMFAGKDDLYDEDGIVVGVAFIEKILMQLEAISV